MFSIATHIIKSSLLAFLITLTSIWIIIWIFRHLFRPNKLHLDIGFIFGIGLLALIIFTQIFLLFSANYAKKYLNKADVTLQSFVSIDNKLINWSDKEIETMKSDFIEKYPFLKKHIEHRSNEEIKNGLADITSYVHSLINKYIWRRIIWMSAALVIIGGILFYRENKQQQRAAYLRSRVIDL